MHKLSLLTRTIPISIPSRLVSRNFHSGLKPLFSRPRSNKPALCTRSVGTMGSLAETDVLFYPDVRRDESVADDYHGVRVADPYRWLEDPDAEEVKAFVAEQVKLMDTVLQSCDVRQKMNNKITELFDYPKFECPFKRGDKYFYFHNKGLQPQSVLYAQDSLDGEPEVILDPNELSEDGTVALSVYSFSENAEFLAFGLSASGSDWVTIKVLRVATKALEPDVLCWVKFSSIAWTHDHKGFFYCRYPTPIKDADAGTETDLNLSQEVYYHFLGTDQSEDILCWKDSDNPKWMFGAEVTDDGKYLVLSIEEGCDPVNRLYLCELDSLPNGLQGWKGKDELLPFERLVDKFDAKYEVIANDGNVFTFRTNKNAPRYKVTRVDTRNPETWTDIIAESAKDVLDSAQCVNHQQLVVSYLSDVKHVLEVRDLEHGTLLRTLPLDIGTVSGISGRRKDAEIFYGFTSFLTPGVIYRCDLSEDSEPTVFKETSVKGFDRTRFETKQVFVPSKDGTKVPMFIVAKKSIALDGKHPALLYGYGGFNISITPSFSASRIVLIQHCGVIFAIANIRGGGEYGEEWHRAGSLGNKQNCFDDFQACSEYLIKEGYTQPRKLGIEGGSNGGLLVAACINQRPDLYGCALAHVGVMDMLRFHKFTIGHAWTTDYGCSEKEEEFKWLIKYSPLHNVLRPWEKPDGLGVQYPPTMLLTADHDDRVVPLHTLKLLATLQHVLVKSSKSSNQTNPIVARIDTKAGHGAGRPTKKMIDEAADRLSFFVKMTGAEWTE
ncbi:prolyl endopeptidase isoform X1 [Selaginella moellendorffii]|uniref:prolyl endopeptidase isoform X1 n=2 Tax=Selaginella moellendorffii TaxID=88036 RepID=UPI000D1C56C3|nr:prolyl endopeptidase isoform X1 [Selaginella moellendorffii]|eukprot:XP_024525496.1 prolyl endopeptidase isoform X1 [Selaginella moellendorffii]